MSTSRFSSASARNFSSWAGPPKRFTATIAFVRGVMFRRTSASSMQKVSGWMSAKMGVAFAQATVVAVADIV